MTIVTQKDTRNETWASDQSAFGQRMLLKMGWSQGKGLGKEEQGACTNLRAVRREDGLGIGAKTDTFGGDGFSTTSRNFHGLLASLKSEYGEEGVDKKQTKKEKKKEKRDKKKEKRDKRKKENNSGSTARIEGIENGITLATNRVSAGHGKKMLESKDLRKKSKEDMAAIFGVKVDAYESLSVWGALSSSTECGTSSELPERKDSDKQSVSLEVGSRTLIEGNTVTQRGKRKKKEKKKRKRKESGDDFSKPAKKR